MFSPPVNAPNAGRIRRLPSVTKQRRRMVAPAAGHLGRWMQVSGHLAGLGAGQGLVAEGQASDLGLVDHVAGQGAGAVRVVVAHRPDQLAAHGQGGDAVAVLVRQAILARAVVEAVAEEDQGRGRQRGQFALQPVEGLRACRRAAASGRSARRSCCPSRSAGRPPSCARPPAIGAPEWRRTARAPAISSRRPPQSPIWNARMLTPLILSLSHRLGDQVFLGLGQDHFPRRVARRALPADLQHDRHGEGRNVVQRRMDGSGRRRSAPAGRPAAPRPASRSPRRRGRSAAAGGRAGDGAARRRSGRSRRSPGGRTSPGQDGRRSIRPRSGRRP